MVGVAHIREGGRRVALLQCRVHGLSGQWPDFAVYGQMVVVLEAFYSVAGADTEIAVRSQGVAAIAAVAELGEFGLQGSDVGALSSFGKACLLMRINSALWTDVRSMVPGRFQRLRFLDGVLHGRAIEYAHQSLGVMRVGGIARSLQSGGFFFKVTLGALIEQTRLGIAWVVAQVLNSIQQGCVVRAIYAEGLIPPNLLTIFDLPNIERKRPPKPPCPRMSQPLP